MKVLTKEEERRHYKYGCATSIQKYDNHDTNLFLSATVRGGTIGGLIGLGAGSAGVLAASRQFHAFRALTLPFRVFLAASTGTFSGMKL